MLGIVTRWDRDKGFGFLRSDADGASYFVHVTALTGEGMFKAKYLAPGDRVEFELGPPRPPHQKPVAKNVKRASAEVTS